MVMPFDTTALLDEDLCLDGAPLGAEDEPPDPVEEAGLVRVPRLGDDELLDALYDDLRRGEQAKAVLAEREMARVIEATQSLDHQFVEGMGQCIARIPLSVFHHWGERYGYEIWRDPKDLLAFLGRQNPGLLIKTLPKAQRGADTRHLLRAGETSAGTVCGAMPAVGVASVSAPTASAPSGDRFPVTSDQLSVVGDRPSAVCPPFSVVSSPPTEPCAP